MFANENNRLHSKEQSLVVHSRSGKHEERPWLWPLAAGSLRAGSAADHTPSWRPLYVCDHRHCWERCASHTDPKSPRRRTGLPPLLIPVSPAPSRHVQVQMKMRPDSTEPTAAPSGPPHRPASCSHPQLSASPRSPQRADLMVFDPGHGRWASIQWGIHSGCRSECTDRQGVITISDFPVYKSRQEIKFEKHFKGKGAGHPKPTLRSTRYALGSLHIDFCPCIESQFMFIISEIPIFLSLSTFCESAVLWGVILLTNNSSVFMVLFLILWHLGLNWTQAITDTIWVNCWKHFYENESQKTVLNKLSFNSVLKYFWSEGKS